MARSSHNYAQLVIGDCGHVCQIWPQIHRIGDPADRVQVVCGECSLAELGIDSVDNVWVFIREPVVKKRTPPSKPVKPVKKKAVTCSICRKQGHVYTDCSLLTGQEVMDGT